MKATMLDGPRDARFEEHADRTILEPMDGIINPSATCICGSDLRPYRGRQPTKGPTPMGHTYCRTAEEIGDGLTGLLGVRSARPNGGVAA